MDQWGGLPYIYIYFYLLQHLSEAERRTFQQRNGDLRLWVDVLPMLPMLSYRFRDALAVEPA